MLYSIQQIEMASLLCFCVFMAINNVCFFGGGGGRYKCVLKRTRLFVAMQKRFYSGCSVYTSHS
jgi:cyanophycinase-like exopeptidase